MDLNADLAEGCPHDAELLGVVTSANVACGAHAGREGDRLTALRLAARRGVLVGAHPSYPDAAGFGRRAMSMSPGALRDSLRAQVGALQRLAARHALPGPRYLKPHGALYHAAALDEAVGVVLVEVVVWAGLRALLHAPGAPTEASAAERGVAWFAEGFADRGYGADGGLLARGQSGALIDDPAVAAAQGLALARGAGLPGRPGERLAVPASLCVHGDGARALGVARAVARALTAEGLGPKPFLT